MFLRLLALQACAASCRAAPVGASAIQAESMRERGERFAADWDSLGRFHDAPLSPTRTARLRAFLDGEQAQLASLPIAGLGLEDRIDLALLSNRIAGLRARLAREDRRREDVVALVPYAQRIVDLVQARQRADPLDARAAADTLAVIAIDAKSIRETLEKATESPVSRTIGFRAARNVERLRESLEEWRAFRSGYDPLFDWWAAEPARVALQRLDEHAAALKKHVAKLEPDDRDTILGDSIGREALLEELRFERIAHTPEELVAMARSELAWCRVEL